MDLEPFREEVGIGMGGGVSLLQAVKAARASISFALNTWETNITVLKGRRREAG